MIGGGEILTFAQALKMIDITGEAITYNCRSFNGCGHSIREIALFLAYKFSMVFEYKEIHHSSSLVRSKRYTG